MERAIKDIPQHSPRLRHAARAALLLLVVAALLLPAGRARTAQAQTSGTSLQNNSVVISGPLQVHLDYLDKSGKQQDVDLQSPSQSLPRGLPSSLQQLQGSQLLTQPLTSAFTQLWNTVKDQDCADITSYIQSVHTGGDGSNSAYNIGNCNWSGVGTLLATQVTQWPDPGARGADVWGDVTGQEILLDYEMPLNTITFTVTTDTTEPKGNAVCDQGGDCDPQFTMVFGVDLFMTLSDLGSSTLACPMAVGDVWNADPIGMRFQPQLSQSVSFETDIQGDAGSAVASATNQWGASVLGAAALAAIGGAPSVSGLAGATGQWLVSLIGTGASSIAGNSVEEWINGFLPSTVSDQPQPDSVKPLTDFDQFNKGCWDAKDLGFSKLDVSATSDGSLRFTLTHPQFTTAPTLQRSDVTSGSVIGPSITLSESEVNAGDQITVSGKNFNSQASPYVWLTWAGTASGDDLEERPAGGQWQQAAYTPQASGNEVTGLAANVAYQFRVRECDAFTCSPFSNTVDATSSAGVSDQVSFYLDSVPPTKQIQITGASATLVSGSFADVAVTIPKDTAGSYKIYAATGGGFSQAGAALTVVAAGSNLPPVIQVTDSTGDVVTRLSSESTDTVTGQNFTAGHPVTVSLDKAGGQLLGTATVDAGNGFQVQLASPNLPCGTHTLVATETANGQTVQAPPLSIDVGCAG